MSFLATFLFVFSLQAQDDSQYEDYETYETFSELDKYQRDWGLILKPSLIYTDIEEDNQVTGITANDRARNITLYDVQLGYIFRGGFYFGLLYAGETQDINTNQPKNTRESVGVSFGYIRWGWAMKATFFPYSKQTLVNTTDIITYSEGTGFQADLGYYFRVGRFASLGPQLVYKSIQYGAAESATTNVNRDATSQHSVLTPMISLMINLYRG